MKNLLILVLALAGMFYFFHDRQTSAHLAEAQKENDELRTELDNTRNAAASAAASAASEAARARQGFGSVLDRVQQTSQPPANGLRPGPSSNFGGSALDRPAYRDNGHH